MKSIVDILRHQVDRVPEKRLYTFLDINGRITHSTNYEDFLARIEVVAGGLYQAGLRPGERVLLAYPPGVELMAALFGCVRIGVLPVPVYPPNPRDFEVGVAKLDLIARDCGATVVLTSRAYAWSLRFQRVRRRVATLSIAPDEASRFRWLQTDTMTSAPQAPEPPRSDVAFLQYTSGSTGAPKGVIVTHDNLAANAPAVVGHDAIGISWLPQYHDMGLIGYYLFFALLGYTTYGFSPLDFLQRPALWFEAISRFRGTAITGPNFAFAYCLRPDKLSDDELEGLDLSSLRVVMSASEPVQPRIVRAFIERFEKLGMNPNAYYVAYGLAENTLGVTGPGRRIVALDRNALARGRAIDALPGHPTRELMSCGPPMAGVEVAIAGPNGQRRQEGQIGEVWARGTSKCAGYWGRPELSQEVFGRRLSLESDEDQTWLDTGDLGFVRGGEVFVCGRKKDLIIVRGQNIHPQDVERIVQDDPSVRPGCVAAFGWEAGATERIVVVAELRNNEKRPDVMAIQRRVRAALGVSVHRVIGIPARAIPKTSSGKIARHRARSDLEAGRLQVLFEQEVGAESSGDDGRVAASGVDFGRLGAPYDDMFRRFGLTAVDRSEADSITLADTNLDSMELAELGADLSGAFDQLGWPQLAATLDLRLLQRLTVTELEQLALTTTTGDPHAVRDSLGMLNRLRQAHLDMEHLRMREEATLPEDIASRLTGFVELPAGERYPLLTGGTGFFGPFLLRSLLEQGEAPVRVLVRAPSCEKGRERLLHGLRTVGCSEAELDRWAPRLRAISGDLEQPRLGLDARTWGELSVETSEVFHNGAIVNYVFDYAGMRSANVGGTETVLRLCTEGRAKVLNHMSTTFIFGWSVKDTLHESDRNPDIDKLDFGYAQTKWVSEQLVHQAMDRGLRGRVFRPALLTPSVDGRGMNFDIAIRLLAFMVKYGLGTSAGNQVSFSPADVAATNIVAIANDPTTLGLTFNVTRDEYAAMGDVTRLLGEMAGTHFEHLSLPDFVPAVIARCQREDILFPLLNFLVRSNANISAMEFKRYDNENFRRARAAAAHGAADPPLRDVVGGIYAFMRREGLLPDRPARGPSS